VGSDQLDGSFVVGVEQHDDRVRIVGKWAPPPVEHRAPGIAARRRTGTHRCRQACCVGSPFSSPPPTGDLDEHARSALAWRPRGHRADSPDRQPYDPIVVAQRNRAAPAQHREHRAVLEQHVGLKIREPDGAGVTNQNVEQVRPEPTAPIGGDCHREVTVAIVTNRVARFSGDHLGLALAVNDGDHAEATPRGDVGPLLTPFEMRFESTEEPPVTVAHGQRLVQAAHPLSIVERSGAHLHASAASELDDLGGVHVVHATDILTHQAHRETTSYPLGYSYDMSITRGLLVGIAGFSLLLASCGGDEPEADVPATASTADNVEGATTINGISTISVDDAALITDNPPEDLVVLDVRTPEEFAEGHLEGAVLVDFYDADFAEQLAALDAGAPYLVYCRSGNRSGQALGVMQQLGFTSAVDVDGGIVAWSGAGLPVTTE